MWKKKPHNNQAFLPLSLILLLVISNMIHSEMGRVCFEAYFSFSRPNKRLEAQDRFDVSPPPPTTTVEVEFIGNSLYLTFCELLFSSPGSYGVHPLLVGSGQGSGSLRHKTASTDIHLAHYSQLLYTHISLSTYNKPVRKLFVSQFHSWGSWKPRSWWDSGSYDWGKMTGVWF